MFKECMNAKAAYKRIASRAFAAIVACLGVELTAGLTTVQVEVVSPSGVANGVASTAAAHPVVHMASSNLTSLLSHRYLTVDLSEGCSAARFPVGWRDFDSDTGWGDEYKTTKLLLRRVPPGSFIMGPDKADKNHLVVLTRPFYIGVFEVTQRQWELVMGTRPSDFTNNYEKLPVENVSFDMIRGNALGAQWPRGDDVDADSFLGVLRSRTGLNFDLPTEAQWEYACSAGRETMYSYGSEPDGRYMWYGENSEKQTHEVGLKLPNRWKLYDMHGNVDEWCLNWNSPLWYGKDPRGFPAGSSRMLRGGNWWIYSSCTTFSRSQADPSSYYSFSGLRLLLDVHLEKQ